MSKQAKHSNAQIIQLSQLSDWTVHTGNGVHQVTQAWLMPDPRGADVTFSDNRGVKAVFAREHVRSIERLDADVPAGDTGEPETPKAARLR